ATPPEKGQSRDDDVVGELTNRGQKPASLRLRSTFQSAGTVATESWKLNSPTTSSGVGSPRYTRPVGLWTICRSNSLARTSICSVRSRVSADGIGGIGFTGGPIGSVTASNTGGVRGGGIARNSLMVRR